MGDGQATSRCIRGREQGEPASRDREYLLGNVWNLVPLSQRQARDKTAPRHPNKKLTTRPAVSPPTISPYLRGIQRHPTHRRLRPAIGLVLPTCLLTIQESQTFQATRTASPAVSCMIGAEAPPTASRSGSKTARLSGWLVDVKLDCRTARLVEAGQGWLTRSVCRRAKRGGYVCPRHNDCDGSRDWQTWERVICFDWLHAADSGGTGRQMKRQRLLGCRRRRERENYTEDMGK